MIVEEAEEEEEEEFSWFAEAGVPALILNLDNLVGGHDDAQEGAEWDELRKRLAEAREFFELEDGEPLRIACGGGRDSLAFHATMHPRDFAKRLATALQGIPDVQLEWLARAYPALAALADRIAGTDTPRQYRRLTSRARRDLARARGLKDRAGCVGLIYYRKFYRWSLHPDANDLSIGKLLESYAMSRRPWAGRAVLLLLVPDERDRWNPLDNPILTAPLHQAAAAAGIEAVLLDRNFGLYDSGGSERADELAEPGAPGAPPLPPIFRA